MNKWKIYFLLFGFALCCGLFGILNKSAHAVESYKISPADDREIKRSFYSNLQISDSKNIDLHYYFYAENNYSENLRVIAYVCDYKPYYYGAEVKKYDDCGLSMVQEAGKFKIKLKGSAYKKFTYSRRTQQIDWQAYSQFYDIHNYENSTAEVDSFTDADFKKGLTLLGGSTLKANNWDLNEGGFLLEPVGGGGSSNSSNNNSGGGFDILGGIKAFFQPMIDSIERTQKVVLSITDNIINGIHSFFSPMIDSIGRMLKALIDLPKLILDGIKSIFDGIINAITTFFVPADGQIDAELSTLKSMFNFDKISTILNATFLPLDSSGFRYDNSCSNMYWDASTQELSNTIYSKGGDKYSKGWRWSTSICKVPQIYIMLARSLIIFAFVWWSAYRLFEFVPILMGSAFIWDKWHKKED